MLAKSPSANIFSFSKTLLIRFTLIRFVGVIISGAQPSILFPVTPAAQITVFVFIASLVLSVRIFPS